MSDSLCRLTVRCGDTREVDLALPRGTTIGQLMSSIVNIVLDGSTGSMTACHWRLSRVGGPALDEWISLTDNDVHDGDVLLLSADEPPAPEWFDLDASHTVARTANIGDAPPLQTLSTGCCVFMAAVGAATLIWSARPIAMAGHLFAGAALAAATAVAAVMARRAHVDPSVCVALSIVAVIFTAATGFLAVPGGPPATHLLLASAAALSSATALMRLLRCGTVLLTAIVVATTLIALVAAAGVLWSLPPGAGGALLATLSLGLLAIAARITIAVTGVGPTANVDTARASLAHLTLTGAVIGSTACAALGSAGAAFGALRDGEPSLRAAALPAVIGLVLMLRTRTFVDGIRRIVLAAGGIVSTAACFVVSVVALPTHAPWISVLVAAAGVAALAPTFGPAVGPIARRIAEIVDYAALAAVVPVACWIGGVFGLVRGMNLI